MKIETKLNPGDTAYYLKDHSLHSAPIRAIQIRLAEEDFDPISISGNVKDPFCKSTIGVFYYTCHGRIPEHRVYSSREELGAAIADGTYNNNPAKDAAVPKPL